MVYFCSCSKNKEIKIFGNNKRKETKKSEFMDEINDMFENIIPIKKAFPKTYKKITQRRKRNDNQSKNEDYKDMFENLIPIKKEWSKPKN